MAIGYGRAAPKPSLTLKQVKAKTQRDDANALAMQRRLVWAREERRCGIDVGSGIACCQKCGRPVYRVGFPQGEVHHIVGRRAKATRYDPDNGVLLCQTCHRSVTEHRITL